MVFVLRLVHDGITRDVPVMPWYWNTGTLPRTKGESDKIGLKNYPEIKLKWIKLDWNTATLPQTKCELDKMTLEHCNTG